MGYLRTLDLPTPAAAPGREWLARALLESDRPDAPIDEWTPIEATTTTSGPVTARNAQLEHGWYRLQWHDDQRHDRFSDPVRMSGPVAHHGPAVSVGRRG